MFYSKEQEARESIRVSTLISLVIENMDGAVASAGSGKGGAGGEAAASAIFPIEQRAFQFCPMEWADEVADVIESEIEAACANGEKSSYNAFATKLGDAKQAEIKTKEMWERLRAAFKRSTDRNLDKLELYAFRNIFILPDDYSENDDPSALAAPSPAVPTTERK